MNGNRDAAFVPKPGASTGSIVCVRWAASVPDGGGGESCGAAAAGGAISLLVVVLLVAARWLMLRQRRLQATVHE